MDHLDDIIKGAIDWLTELSIGDISAYINIAHRIFNVGNWVITKFQQSEQLIPVTVTLDARWRVEAPTSSSD